jgi:hypothetical protein
MARYPSGCGIRAKCRCLVKMLHVGGLSLVWPADRVYAQACQLRQLQMKRVLVASIALICLLTQCVDACAAGPFDGEWTGSATSTIGRCKPATVTLTVQGQDVTGQARFEIDAPNINGTVRDDGSFGATIGWQPLTGNFSEDRFEGTFKNGDCMWKMLLHRRK